VRLVREKVGVKKTKGIKNISLSKKRNNKKNSNSPNLFLRFSHIERNKGKERKQ